MHWHWARLFQLDKHGALAHQTDISISLIMTVEYVDYHSASIFSHFIWLLFVNNVNKAFLCTIKLL